MATVVTNPVPTGQKAEQSARTDIRITRGMRVSEILALLPEAGPVIAQYGLSCFSCSARDLESLEEGCHSHGFAEEDIEDLVTDLNELLASRPPRPATLTITQAAAERLAAILEAEGKTGWTLIVMVDPDTGFCLEFAQQPEEDHGVFVSDDVSSVRLAATAATLARIGGATIDLRDGRFKLDLPEDAAATCRCGKAAGECGCGGACHSDGGANEHGDSCGC